MAQTSLQMFCKSQTLKYWAQGKISWFFYLQFYLFHDSATRGSSELIGDFLEVHIASYILYHTREVTYSIIQIFPVTYSIILSVTYGIIWFFQWRIVSYFSKLPNRSLRYYGGLKVKYKNGWRTVFWTRTRPDQSPLMLVWGLVHPGRPKGTL